MEKACQTGNFAEVLSCLLNEYSNDHYGRLTMIVSGLTGASSSGNINICKLLFDYAKKHYIKMNTYEIIRVLTQAYKYKRIEIMKLCVSYYPEWNDDIFHMACQDDNLDIANMCIKLGYNNYDDGLLYACGRSSISIVNLMIAHGAKTNNALANMRFNTNNIPIIDILIKHGAICSMETLKIAYSGWCNTTIKYIIDLLIKNNKFVASGLIKLLDNDKYYVNTCKDLISLGFDIKLVKGYKHYDTINAVIGVYHQCINNELYNYLPKELSKLVAEYSTF